MGNGTARDGQARDAGRGCETPTRRGRGRAIEAARQRDRWEAPAPRGAFAREANPAGEAWAAAPAGDGSRPAQQAATAPGPILERSGDLASRILADWDDSSAVAGTNVVYAATHHFGDPRRGIPARPFLGVSADARDAILQAIVDDLVR